MTTTSSDLPAAGDRAEAWRLAMARQFGRLTPSSLAGSRPLGRCVGSRLGDAAVVAPGRLAIYDTGRPYELRIEGAWTCAVFALPRDRLGLPWRALAAAMDRAHVADAGPGALLRDLVLTSAGGSTDVSDSAATGGAAAVGRERMGEAGRERMGEAGRERMGDAGAALLAAARKDLADPVHGQRTVAAIAHRWCFPDAAHFARTFKAEFGCSPRDVRFHR